MDLGVRSHTSPKASVKNPTTPNAVWMITPGQVLRRCWAIAGRINTIGSSVTSTRHENAAWKSNQAHPLTNHARRPNTTSCRGSTTARHRNSSPAILSAKNGSHAARIQYRPGPSGANTMNGGCTRWTWPNAASAAPIQAVSTLTAASPARPHNQSPRSMGRRRRRARQAHPSTVRHSLRNSRAAQRSSGPNTTELAATNHITTRSAPVAETSAGMTTRVATNSSRAPAPKIATEPAKPSGGMRGIRSTAAPFVVPVLASTDGTLSIGYLRCSAGLSCTAHYRTSANVAADLRSARRRRRQT